MDQGQQVRERVPCAGVDEALTRVLELFGKRWTGLIVAVLTRRPAYFAELRRAIPRISERMLSDRLTELADVGLIVREVDPGPPLRVSYSLTEAGQALRPALHELGAWAEKYLPEDGPCVVPDPVTMGGDGSGAGSGLHECDEPGAAGAGRC
jgi:DNA-binding HxlR family transcriptional regulator